MPKQPKQPESEQSEPERTPEEIAAYERHERIVAGIDGGRMVLAGAGDGHRADWETRQREDEEWRSMTEEQRDAILEEAFERNRRALLKAYPDWVDEKGNPVLPKDLGRMILDGRV